MRHGSGDDPDNGNLIGLLTLVVGCACKPGMKAFDVRVQPRLSTLPDQPTVNSTEVHLVAVNQRDYARWVGHPVNQYWSPSDTLRREAQSSGRAYVMVFSADDPKPKQLSRSDPIWSKWRADGATQLLVLAFLPGAQTESGAAAAVTPAPRLPAGQLPLEGRRHPRRHRRAVGAYDPVPYPSRRTDVPRLTPRRD